MVRMEVKVQKMKIKSSNERKGQTLMLRFNDRFYLRQYIFGQQAPTTKGAAWRRVFKYLTFFTLVK